MTQDEIIEMTRQAGASTDGKIWGMYFQDLKAFAKLVAAKEREACAKVCDEREKYFIDLFHKYGYEQDSGAMLASMQCAKAIRARGEQA